MVQKILLKKPLRKLSGFIIRKELELSCSKVPPHPEGSRRAGGGGGCLLQIPQRISPRIQNIPFDIHPKCNEEINDNGRSHRKEGDINKILADGGSGDTHFLTNGCANTEYMPLDKMLEAFHTAKIDRIYTKNKWFKLKNSAALGFTQSR